MEERMKRIKQAILVFLNRQSENGISSLAAQGAYYMLVSIVPMMILILTVLRYTLLDIDQAKTMLIENVPYYFQPYLAKIVEQIYQNAGLVLSFSAVMLLWSASKGVYILVDGCHMIFDQVKDRPYWKTAALALGYTAILVIAVPVLMAVTIFGGSLLSLLFQFVPALKEAWFLFVMLRLVFSAGVIFAILCLLYRFAAGVKLKFSHLAIGALTATILWQIFSYAFGFYVQTTVKQSSVYGGLNVILMIMLWFYSSIYIFFIGCQIVQMAAQGLKENEDIIKIRTTAVEKMKRHRQRKSKSLHEKDR